jgi:hypothetical protein
MLESVICSPATRRHFHSKFHLQCHTLASIGLTPATNRLGTDSETESSPVCDNRNRAQDSVHFDEL